jgi:hypothetical protein
MWGASGKGPYSRTSSAGASMREEAALRRSSVYPTGGAAGSNNVVVNPATGADSQRRARPRPTLRAVSAAWSSTSARWIRR